MHGSLYQFPDLYFVFITNDAKTFEELVTNGENGNEIWRREQYKIIATNTSEIEEFTGHLHDHLKTIPKRIVQPFCQLNSNEWRWKNNIDLRYKRVHDYCAENWNSTGKNIFQRLSRRVCVAKSATSISYKSILFDKFRRGSSSGIYSF